MRWDDDTMMGIWLNVSVVIERQCPLNVQPISIPVAIGCNKTCQNMILIYFIFRFGTTTTQKDPESVAIYFQAEKQIDNRNNPSFSSIQWSSIGGMKVSQLSESRSY